MYKFEDSCEYIYRKLTTLYTPTTEDVINFYKNHTFGTIAFGNYLTVTNAYECEKVSWNNILNLIHFRNNGDCTLTQSGWYNDQHIQYSYYNFHEAPIFLENFDRDSTNFRRNHISSYDGYHSIFIDLSDMNIIKLRITVYTDFDKVKRGRLCWFDFDINKDSETYKFLSSTYIIPYAKSQIINNKMKEFQINYLDTLTQEIFKTLA